MENWIYENNVTWQYAYGNTLDTLKVQEQIEESNKQIRESIETLSKETEYEELKPTDKVKRRELFAKMAEQRQKNRY